VKDKPAAKERFEPLQRPAADRDAKVIVTEITVFDDGEVRTPKGQVSREEKEDKLEPIAVSQEATEDSGKGPGRRVPQASPVSDRGLEKSLEEAATARPPGRAPGGNGLSTTAGKAEQPDNLSGNISRQLLDGLLYALVAGVAVFSVWLLLAIIAGQWSNRFAIVTCSMIVPWVLFRGTTMRKHQYVRVCSTPPHPIWISILSVAIIAVITPPAELLAYGVLCRSDAQLRFSGFMKQYFQTADWIILLVGLSLAFLLPFLLKASENRNMPSIRK